MESFFDRLVVLHFSHTNGTGVVFAVEPYLQDNECVGQSNHSVSEIAVFLAARI